MVEVHQLGDAGRRSSSGNPPLLSSGVDMADPSNASLSFASWVIPGFSAKTVIVALSVIDLLVYIASIALGSMPGKPLSPNSRTLALLGACIPPLIRGGEVWRLVCPIFLHLSALHIMVNVYMQLAMGMRLEKRYGHAHFLLLYGLSGVLGNLFSASCWFCGPLRAGASTSGFGLVGCQLAELALIWHLIPNKEQVIFNTVLYVVLNVLFLSFSFGGSVDHLGHVGGLVTGAAVGVLLNWDLETKPR
eukprot:GHVT01073917.1.p1 GENE.GHVT01073917.1~~GHVT01073917.1.p1  ORF type:complete len:247 (+),score=40.53 GHVT01073917.1:246-986(+)